MFQEDFGGDFRSWRREKVWWSEKDLSWRCHRKILWEQLQKNLLRDHHLSKGKELLNQETYSLVKVISESPSRFALSLSLSSIRPSKFSSSFLHSFYSFDLVPSFIRHILKYFWQQCTCLSLYLWSIACEIDTLVVIQLLHLLLIPLDTRRLCPSFMRSNKKGRRRRRERRRARGRWTDLNVYSTDTVLRVDSSCKLFWPSHFQKWC